MTLIPIETAEDARQFAFLHDPADGSARYAAAMYFFMAGKLGAAAVERYRVLSKEARASGRDAGAGRP